MKITDCIFCGKKHEQMNGFSTPSYADIICDTCGAVAITQKALEYIYDHIEEKKQLIQLLNEKNIKDRLELGIAYEVIASGEVKDALLSKKILLTADQNDTFVKLQCPQYTLDAFLAQYPKTTINKLNRALCTIARIKSLPNTFDTDIIISKKCFWTESDREALYFTDMLVTSGLCVQTAGNGLGRIIPPITLTLDGWQRFEELEKIWQNSTTAFVAMWFDDDTKIYEDAVYEAARQAGYEAVVIKNYDHNNFIMDEVINQINEAKFVIADFTCIQEKPEENGKIPGGVRGGVYFEAGYAKGLGKEVIVTCRDDADSKKRRHFDIDQLNTLFWSEKDGVLYDCNGNDFIHRLAERIKATVGKGKLFTEKM